MNSVLTSLRPTTFQVIAHRLKAQSTQNIGDLLDAQFPLTPVDPLGIEHRHDDDEYADADIENEVPGNDEANAMTFVELCNIRRQEVRWDSFVFGNHFLRFGSCYLNYTHVADKKIY